MKAQTPWRWEEGLVDEQKEHIELHYGRVEESPAENWVPIARIAKNKPRLFVVEWLVKPDSPSDKSMIAAARRELDFFLVEHDIKVMSDHWEYAIYHCGTSGNMYSSVHWSYFPTGNQGERHVSRVITLSAEESKRIFGDSGKPGKYIKSG
jgi:hypothetical protein